MITINIGIYEIGFEQGSLPVLFDEYKKSALLYEEYTSSEYKAEDLVIAAGLSNMMPSLVVKMKYWPNAGGFTPCLLFIQEKDILFIGAGQTVLVYDLLSMSKVDEDYYNEGVLGWLQHENYVFLLAECDVACWDNTGKKLWERFVDPPYEVIPNGDKVKLKMLDESIEFEIEKGP